MTRMISILDTKARDDQKENFYHGLLLGLLRSDPTWLIMSNVESGDGFSDILIEPDDPDAGIIYRGEVLSDLRRARRGLQEGSRTGQDAEI